jgi:predicted nucleic acid-binding protein
MLVVDASCLIEVLTGTQASAAIRARIAQDPDQAAPHVIDVEVYGAVRDQFLRQRLDRTAAAQAVEDLAAWPGERFGHRAFLPRAWELRDTVRGSDAMYVALAEALEAPLVTRDARLGRAIGPRCRIEVI